MVPAQRTQTNRRTRARTPTKTTHYREGARTPRHLFQHYGSPTNPSRAVREPNMVDDGVINVKHTHVKRSFSRCFTPPILLPSEHAHKPLRVRATRIYPRECDFSNGNDRPMVSQNVSGMNTGRYSVYTLNSRTRRLATSHVVPAVAIVSTNLLICN